MTENCLTQDVAVSLANVLVSSRLDCRNSLPTGDPKKYMDRLQKVQNVLLHVLDHSAPLQKLKELHSLPVNIYGIVFNLNIITQRALSLSEPPIYHAA